MKGPVSGSGKARPTAARLFLLACILCLAAVVLVESGEYLLSARRKVTCITAEAPAEQLLPGEAKEEQRMSINDATPDALQRTPGVGPALAQAILDTREEMGGFAFWEEVLEVPGIGRKRLDALAEYFFCPLPQ